MGLQMCVSIGRLGGALAVVVFLVCQPFLAGRAPRTRASNRLGHDLTQAASTPSERWGGDAAAIAFPEPQKGRRNDHTAFVPPEVEKPPAGGSYQDPVFGARVTRLTDDAATFDTGGVYPEYAQISVFNRDDSFLILRPSNGTIALHDGEGSFLRTVGSPHGTAYEPRWSRMRPTWLYYNTGAGRRVYRYDVVDDTHTLVADYGEQGSGRSRSCEESINFGGGQSDVSDNERINVTCDDRYLMVMDLQTGTDFGVGDAHPPGSPGFDAVTLAMDGESMAVSFNRTGADRFTGFEQWSKDGSFMVQLMHSGGHLAMARDTSGTPVMVVNNANSYPQQPPCPNCDWNGIVKISLDGTATRTLLIGLIGAAGNNAAAELFAGASGDGWVYVATYRGHELSREDWLGYDQEIFRIRLDPSDGHNEAYVDRIVHHRSTTVRYIATPLLSVSMTGRRLIYPSDFGEPDGPVDTYMIVLDDSDLGPAGVPPTAGGPGTSAASAPARSSG